LYGNRKFLGTLMRHFLLAVFLLASGVRESAVTAGLVLPARLPQRLSPRRPTAADRAVPIPVIAPSAQEENLPAILPATDNEAK
jgi:hypothetical protein